MPTLEVEDLIDSWSPHQKRAVLDAQIRDLLPQVNPTEEQRAADVIELAQRYKNRDQSFDVEDLLKAGRENASNPEQ